MKRVLEKRLKEAIQVEYDTIDQLLYLSNYIDNDFTKEEQENLIDTIERLHKASYARAMEFMDILRQVNDAGSITNFGEVMDHVTKEMKISKENLNKLF